MKNTCAITTEHCAARSSVYDATFKKKNETPFFILFKKCKFVFKLHLCSSELHKKTRHLQRESSVNFRINNHLAPFKVSVESSHHEVSGNQILLSCISTYKSLIKLTLTAENRRFYL